jgi:hypothetical protein
VETVGFWIRLLNISKKLDGVDGAPGWQGPSGTPGSIGSCVYIITYYNIFIHAICITIKINIKYTSRKRIQDKDIYELCSIIFNSRIIVHRHEQLLDIDVTTRSEL